MAGVLLGAVIPDLLVDRALSTLTMVLEWRTSRDHLANWPTSRRPLLPVGDNLLREFPQAPGSQLGQRRGA